MAEDIDRIARMLGAQKLEPLPNFKGGMKGLAQLSESLRARLETDTSKRTRQSVKSSRGKQPKAPRE